ncbi:GTPase [Polaromonas naphthalenivorans]|uniref:G domain-containing protein n=1 Tax=Polaromonas naphthalenivorans (strain CJ2) TaxID=365044 RepID=A1VQX2_POLNA|nr:GTPase [Polaromonas naphthalenivorans]ABM38050.1 hypothetical protein Pnap_2748 [Polaromonas naphthalenivorans CJ2]
MIEKKLFEDLKCIDPNLSIQLDAWSKAINSQQQKICVAACGLLKAGKSTLLNMLTDHLDTEFFKSGIIRETIRNQSFVTNDFVFMDTPGIDAKVDDDKEAFEGIAKADILLMVHHPQGELQMQELEFLKKLVLISSKDLGKRLVLVFTHFEAYKEIQDDLAAKVISQCKSVIGIEPKYFWVSNTSYKKGQLEGKSRLREASNIPILKAHINVMHDKLGPILLAARSARLEKNRKQFMGALQNATRERREKINQIRAPHLKNLGSFSKRMERLHQDLDVRLAAYDKI